MRSSDVQIYIEHKEHVSYPDSKSLFAPSEHYPEYVFPDISTEKNDIYEMVRNALKGMGFDVGRFGRPDWNPLGDIIKPGDVVVLKPNLVKDYSDDIQYDCTLTHPSVIKVIVDYCIIAKAGKIIIGDAPIQGADIDAIVRDLSIDRMISFYSRAGFPVEFIDFRNLIVETVHHVSVVKKEKNPESDEYVTVHMGGHSRHFEDAYQGRYGVIGYFDDQVNAFHSGNTHDYVISKYILEADVVINLPKPKTHRYAGITAAQKNFVGACSDKESLPHFKGGPQCIGADEASSGGFLSRLISRFYRMHLKEGKKKRMHLSRLYFYLYTICVHLKGSRFFIHGAWYGNDTIWRTIIDINKIILYADQKGKYSEETVKRKVLTIGDMVLCGEKKGPLWPSPKELGMVMVSNNMAAFDYIFCTIAGFDEAFIPAVYHSVRDKKLCVEDWAEIVVASNDKGINLKKITEIIREDKWGFVPHPYWKDVL